MYLFLACSPGEYRALSQNSTRCYPCPAFTNVLATGAGECACLTGYYRSAEEGSEVACTRK